MTQYSHMSTPGACCCLLIGSYPVWQWQDRDELVSSLSLNVRLEKVSRVIYTFFQTNDNGYVTRWPV